MTDQDWADLVARRIRSGVIGVLSTGIFCSFGCPARTPLRRNVRLFDSCEAAAAAGLRVCKRCGGLPKSDQPVVRTKLNAVSTAGLELP
ncbi:MAG: Ada metal-binding domain-containing protein [Paracoccaceae bacterium]